MSSNYISISRNITPHKYINTLFYLQLQLFKPCFKRLFDICNMYGKDLVKKNTRGGSSGTRQLLGKIAQQNVDTVINLEKTMFGE